MVLKSLAKSQVPSAREIIAAALGKPISELPSEVKFNKQMEHLQKQSDKAKQQLAKLEAEQKQQLAKLKAKEKRLEHERRMLAGAVFLELFEQGKFPRSEFLELMNQHAKSKKHRVLFDLPTQETFPDWLEAELAQTEGTQS